MAPLPDSPAEAQRTVAVVGGGIAGLATALEIQQRYPMLRVRLLEASDRLGGVIASAEHAGHTFELGPDSLLRRIPDTLEFCRQVGIESELIPTGAMARGVYSVHRGRLIRVPQGMAAMQPESAWEVACTPLLSPWGKLALLRERFVPPRSGPGDESLADFTRRRLGRNVLDRLVQPLAGGIFMGDPEQLSIAACFPQLLALEQQHGSITRGMQAAAAKQPKPPQRESVFVAPQRGLERLVTAASNLLPADSIELQAEVERVERLEQGWRVVRCSGLPLDVGGLVLACPARIAGRLLGDVDGELSHLLTAITATSSVIAVLAYQRGAIRHSLDATGFVVPHVEPCPLAAGTFASIKYEGRSPADEVLFRVFLGGSQHAEVLEWDDPQLISVATAELAKLVGATQPPLWSRVVRWRNSMPQYLVGHLDRVARIEQLTKSHTGLALAGNSYRGVGVPYCIHSGKQAATQVGQVLAS